VLFGQRTLPAVGLSRPIAQRDRARVAADGARHGLGTVHPAVPVLASALEGPQRLAALGADRRRDVHRAGVAQRGQQLPDRLRRGRAAIGENLRPGQQRLSESAAFSPTSGHAGHHLGDAGPLQARLEAGDQRDDDTDRVDGDITRRRTHRVSVRHR